MLAGDARQLCPGAVFLPDNAAACFDELERLASIIRKYATVSVAIVSNTSLLVDISAVSDGAQVAESIRTLARSWSGLAVQAAVGNTPEEATDAARSSRRSIAIVEPRSTGTTALRESNGPISVTTAIARVDGDRKRVLTALRKLAVAVAAYDWDFRELHMMAESERGPWTIRLRFESPTDVQRAEDRIWDALGKLPKECRGRLRFELRRLSPRVVTAPLPQLAKAG
jgi:hypothetical protein